MCRSCERDWWAAWTNSLIRFQYSQFLSIIPPGFYQTRVESGWGGMMKRIHR
jgi:hypothetical protein